MSKLEHSNTTQNMQDVEGGRTSINIKKKKEKKRKKKGKQ
jgi:hypothetical protein